MNQSVNRLVREGHSLRDIGDYPLSKFTMFLDACAQNDADHRIGFVADMTAVVGSLFSKDSPAGDHIALLQGIVAGVKNVAEE